LSKAVSLLVLRCYQLLGWLFFAVSFPPYLLYRCVAGRGLHGLGQRLGFLSDIDTGTDRALRIWLHASSVGEVQAAKALLQELKKTVPAAVCILTVMTEQGYAVARQQMAPEVRVFFAPLDLCGVVGRVLRKIQPSIYVCLETELWPNMIREAHRMGVKLLLLNGRMSERSYRRYRRFPRFMADLLAKFAWVSAIDRVDADRYRSLGLGPEKIVINGNAKYDHGRENCSAGTEAGYRTLLGLTGQPLLVAGSTHSGEEEQLLGVVHELKASAAGRGLIWVVAPRHLNRLAAVENLFKSRGVEFERFSEVKLHGRRTDVVLVDVMGELAGLYSVATVVFCGGSLVARGGHNVMEGAVCGKPVFYGPNMKDFADAAHLLESAQAGFPVKDGRELTAKILSLLQNRDEYTAVCRRAKEAALAQQGASRRQARMVRDMLAG
jgi:3-deoxy-D-manno-octulosonic-acid transferase